MSAVISPCGTYRYRLERVLGEGPTAAIIGVNPSTADATIDDPTIRKDMGFGRRLGWGRILKGNLFAYRATDVRELRDAADPVGPKNNLHLAQILAEADVVVYAWGPTAKLPPKLRREYHKMVTLAWCLGVQPMCFGTAQDGQPLHTLMLAYDTPLEPWYDPDLVAALS